MLRSVRTAWAWAALGGAGGQGGEGDGDGCERCSCGVLLCGAVGDSTVPRSC
ncbi:MAG: hypothetical protein MZW92_59610 [Comamonadaceae bacterium]|nr:hypothetical protein [Comamonadaceae bacterium]